jgi:hypothetical protein
LGLDSARDLNQFKQLKALKLCHNLPNPDLTENNISSLTNLTSLELSALTNINPVVLSALPNLTDLALGDHAWGPRLHLATNLRRLWIQFADRTTMRDIISLTNLTQLDWPMIPEEFFTSPPLWIKNLQKLVVPRAPAAFRKANPQMLIIETIRR